MAISQISVFVENRPGRLADITAVLAKNSIDIRALSVACVCKHLTWIQTKQKLPYRIDPYPKDIYRYKMVCGRRH